MEPTVAIKEITERDTQAGSSDRRLGSPVVSKIRMAGKLSTYYG